VARLATARPHCHRVRPARIPAAPSTAGPFARAAARVGVARRARQRQRGRCVHRLRAAEARGGRRAAPCAHGARSRVRPPRGRLAVSLRLRLALFGAAVVALALVLFGVLVYTLLARSVTSNQDTQLRERARQAASATNIADLSPHPLIAAADLKNSTDVYVE